MNPLGRIRSGAFAEESGFSLVELLVVITIMSVVGTVVTAATLTGMRATRQGQDRVEAIADLQKGLERIAREVRVADGSAYPPGVPGELRVSAPYEVILDVYRDDQRIRFRYWRPTPAAGQPEQLWERRETYSPSDAPTPSIVERPFISPLANGSTPIFRYLDANGAPATGADISRVVITLVRDLREQDPITVDTVVNLRNAHWRAIPEGTN